jgi:serine O-acetyltransferase
MWSAMRADIRLYWQLQRQRLSSPFAFVRLLTSRGLLLLAVHRLARHLMQMREQRRWSPQIILIRLLVGIGYELTVLLAKADVQASTCIEPGVYLSDRGNLVIGATRIGSGSVLHHCVTIGMDLTKSGRPSIGSNVWIGPDCVIYGAIQVGDGATILAGSVVTKNVPPRAVISGNPARVLRLDYDNQPLRSSALPTVPEEQLSTQPASV